MKQNRVLLTGFKSRGFAISTSKYLLEKIQNSYDKFLFTNDFKKIDSEVDKILSVSYDYIIMFGWKPTIKSLRIEIEAHSQNNTIYTNMPLNTFLNLFKDNNISYKLSLTPGNSYCNHAYYQMLDYIISHNLNTKVIFIHIPHIDNFIEIQKVIDLLNKGVILCQK